MLSLLHRVSPLEEVRGSGVCDGGEVLNQQVNLTLD